MSAPITCTSSLIGGIAAVDVRGYPIGPIMDGYSVTEAASVLGVPEGRVWELLARGVLSGTPEGDSMRVFLKAQPGPIAPASADAQRGERPRTNGNGGAHDGGEASAFRELLTEFRNLTERYGQALLALGEARGEVAGLRSRVDLLEARLDLRLPGPAPEAAVPWTPASTEAARPMERSAAVPPPAEPVEAEAAARVPATRAPAKRGAPKRGAAKRRATKRANLREVAGGGATGSRPARARSPAVSSIAAALARAEDPTISELTGGREAAEALAASLAKAIAPVEVADQVQVEELPEELAPVAAAEPLMEAEPEAEAAAEEPSTTMEPMAIEPEPDWFADGDFAWLDAAEMERTATPVSEPEAVTGEPAAAPTADEPAPSLQAEDAGGQVAVEMAIPEVEAEPDDQPQDEPVDQLDDESEDEPDVESDDEPDGEPDDEPGWGASPAAAGAEAAETDAEIQAAFEEMPEGGTAPTATESEIQAAFDEVPERGTAPTATEPEIQAAFDESPAVPERPTQAASSNGNEVEVAVINPATPPVADEPLAWSSDDVDAAEAKESAEDVAETQDAGASELESASSWRPQSQDSWRPTRTPAVGLQLSDAELAKLAADEGWDTSEVDAIRTLIGRGTPQPEPRNELPGAGELREAMAALEAIPIQTDTTSAAKEGDEEWWRQPSRAAPSAPVSDASRPTPRGATPEPFPSPAAPDPDWLRRRRGPAADAYRRIRRLFSG
jgi:hypothetical protein